MQSKKYHIVGTVPIINRSIVKEAKIETTPIATPTRYHVKSINTGTVGVVVVGFTTTCTISASHQ